LIAVLFASRCCHSTSGFVLLEVAPVLLLDRYVFRLLPWSQPLAWGKDLCGRMLYLVCGAGVAYLIRFGSVPVREAVFVGIFLSLGAFFFESVMEVVLRVTNQLRGRTVVQRDGTWSRLLCTVLVVLPLLVLGTALEPLHPLRTVPKRTPAVVELEYEN